jgi:glycosyltransferase involved in cell wall biosynthesis
VEGRLRGLGQAVGDVTLEAIAALRALEASGHEPIVLGYHPVARMNPYQALLYQRSWDAGIAALPIVREARIGELADLARRGSPTVLHLHWLNQVLAHADSVRDAQGLRKAFLRVVDAYLAAGGRLVWTVHNIVPHGARFEAEEAALSADIVDRCAAVHILARRTPELVAGWFTIPADKILEVPHPSYAGAYEDFITREQARHELGLWPDEIVHVVFGAIKPYKGLNELLDAWDGVAADGVPRRLVVAGGPSDEAGVAETLERAALHPSVLLHARKIPATEMQIFLRAADVAVMPYLRSLNSGALMLALTFGLPVVVPAGGGLAEIVDERFARVFDPYVPDSLGSALRAADELVNADARAAAGAVATALAPGPLSERFARDLRSRLASAAPAEVASARRD